MSLFGIGSGDKKTTTSSVTTTTNQTDSSRTAGANSTYLESGAEVTINDVSEKVAQAAILANQAASVTAMDTNAAIAESGILTSASLGEKGLNVGESIALKSLANQKSQNKNTIDAAQDSISFARQLAEIGLTSKVSADTGGTTTTIAELGKWLGIVVGILALGVVGFSVFNKKGTK